MENVSTTEEAVIAALDEEDIIFNEENISKYLIAIINDNDFNIIGKASEEITEQLDRLMNSDVDLQTITEDILDLCSNSAVEAADYAFRKGLKEGIRLFRVLMHL